MEGLSFIIKGGILMYKYINGQNSVMILLNEPKRLPKEYKLTDMQEPNLELEVIKTPIKINGVNNSQIYKYLKMKEHQYIKFSCIKDYCYDAELVRQVLRAIHSRYQILVFSVMGTNLLVIETKDGKGIIAPRGCD